MTKSYDLQSANGSLQIPKSRDPVSANGSFQNSRSWADELSAYKAPSSQQTELPFKVMKPDLTRDSVEKSAKEETMFTGDVNRFKVYSAINRSDSSSEESLDSNHRELQHGLSLVGMESRVGGEDRTPGAQDMLNHLRKLQEELKSSEQTRKILEKNLADRQAQPHQEHLEQYKPDKYDSVRVKEKPLQIGQDLTQYSYNSDISLDKDKSVTRERQPSPVYQLPVLSGTSSVQRELPVRKSPIGDLIRSRSPMEAGESKQEITTTEYSFTMSDGKQRSTLTPGN